MQLHELDGMETELRCSCSALPEDINNGPTPKVWISPFQDEPLCKEKDIHLVTKPEATLSARELKRRPKTACAMTTDQHDITKSKHENLIKLLNSMETRRLRRTAFSPRCKSACTFEEKINDIDALRSFYEIYLGKSKDENSVPEYRNSAAVIFRKLSDTLLAPQARKSKSTNMSCNHHKRSVSVCNASESNRKLKSDFRKNSGHNRLNTVPITNVQFIREQKKLDRRKRTSGPVPPNNETNYKVSWTKIPQIRIDDETDGLVLENLEYELTGVDKEHCYDNDHPENVDRSNGDPYSISMHRNYVHRAGTDYSGTTNSRLQSSSTRTLTPHVIVNDTGDIKNAKFSKAEYPTKRTCISDKNGSHRKFDVKVNTLVRNAEKEEDEILYQSTSMKERLISSRSPTDAWSEDGKDSSDIENDKVKSRGAKEKQVIDNNKDIISLNAKDNSLNNDKIMTNSSKTLLHDNNDSTSTSVFIKRNNFLASDDSTDNLSLYNLKQTKKLPNESNNSNDTTQSSDWAQPYERSKSAFIITHKNKNNQISDQPTKITRPKSSIALGSNNKPQRGKSVKSGKSKSGKLSKEDKVRDKERKEDLKKLKALEMADKQQEKKNKELADEEQKLEEQKKVLEDDQNNLLREEQEMKQAIDDRKLALAMERKQKRKEEADKRRLEVERRREEKRLADLEMSRKNAELAALAREEKEKAEALQAELKRLEEEERQRILREEEEERERQLQREREEQLELERAKEQERLEVLRLEEERKKREEVIMAAERKLRLLEEQQEKQREKQRQEQLRIQEEKGLLRKRENARLQEEKRLREEELRRQEERQRRLKEEEDRKRLAILTRKRENLMHRKGLAYTKYNQRITKSNEFSYFVQVPRQVWELPIGWQKKPKYKAGGSVKK